MTKLADSLQSKSLTRALWSLAGVMAALAVFKAGVMAGYHKASFSYRWGDTYHRNFAGPRGGFWRDFSDRDFLDAHGTIGRVISIDPASSTAAAVTFLLQGRDEAEKVVLADEQTAIRRFRQTLAVEELAVDDVLVVIGQPNAAGQIAAKFIRVMPRPPLNKYRLDPPRPPRER